MFNSTKLLKVFLDIKEEYFFVGRLAIKDNRFWFEYDQEFLNLGLEISPFKLPNKKFAQSSPDQVFAGLFGVFNDSLPDAWGKLLIDRHLRSQSINPEELNSLDRLALVGKSGYGALCYEPDLSEDIVCDKKIDLNKLAKESLITLEGNVESSVQELLSLNASAGGARPKVSIYYNPKKKILKRNSIDLADEAWLVKFPALSDDKEIGKIEYAYYLMAKKARIEIQNSVLLEESFFATKRFDREGFERFHVHTASGLLQADHHYPSLDYENLLKLCFVLTKSIKEVEKLFRLMIFNVLAHNRDDHSKNFSFIMDSYGLWKLAPAYDLTFSYGPGAEHSMLVAGEGKNPNKKHILTLARKFNIDSAEVIYEEVRNAVKDWDSIANDIGIRKKIRAEIASQLCSIG